MFYQILMLEQDITIGKLLSYSLMKEGSKVEWCQSLEQLSELVVTQPFDILILDTTEPGINGLTALSMVKGKSPQVPVIVLSEWSHEGDATLAFSLGAEDVISKPFEYSELVARIKAIMRRINENTLYPIYTNEEEIFKIGFIDVYPKRLEIVIQGEIIEFRKDEFDLFFYLLKNPGTVFSSNHLYDVIYGPSVSRTNRIVYLISAIRKRIQIANPRIKIQTIPSVGYKLKI